MSSYFPDIHHLPLHIPHSYIGFTVSNPSGRGSMRIDMGMISLLCLSILPLAAQAEGVSQKGTSEAIERALQRGDETALLELRASLEVGIKTGHPDKYSYYYLGLSDYELAVLDKDNGKATGYIDAAEDEALLGSSYGVEIGLHPFKGIYLGSKVTSHLDHAAKLVQGNPRVLLLQ